MKISHLSLLFLCLFSSCATRSSPVITMETYLEVQRGETREDILREFGEPMTIEMNSEGIETFIYVERFFLNQEVQEERHYYIYFKNDKVIGKAYKTGVRPQIIDSDML